MTKKIIISIITLIIGMGIGILIGVLIASPKSEFEKDISFLNEIKNSSYNTEEVSEKIDNLEKLNQRLLELNTVRSEIESEIVNLKNSINNSTNLNFENEIFEKELKEQNNIEYEENNAGNGEANENAEEDHSENIEEQNEEVELPDEITE